MDEMICFERFLYEDEQEIIIKDYDFCVDRIVQLPKIRPHRLEKAVSVSIGYCQISDFRQKILNMCNVCPILIYRLFKCGMFLFEEIEPLLSRKDIFLFCYYFRKEIDDFDTLIQIKRKQFNNAEEFLEDHNDIEQMIQYGFVPSSIEYCLKYDAIDDLQKFQNLKQEAKWSPFEWSYKPKNLDLLSFSGFFGSVKCFKHLLMNGFVISDKVVSNVVCNGCLDLFHLCHGDQFITPECLSKSSIFFHISLIVFLIENGSDINAKGLDVDIVWLVSLLFIGLLKKVILVLLNI